MTAPTAPPIPSTDALLRALADATATVTGQEFFDALTRVLGTTLHANHVALSQLVPGRTDRVETVSAFAGGAHQPNFAYDLDVTPCKNVLGKTFTHHPDRVAELFPDDHFFVATNTRSYIGVPLSTPDQRPMGLMTLCHDHATHHLAHLRDVLTLFAGRAASEIARLHAEHSLRTALASLDEQVRDRTAALRHEIDQHAATEHDLRVSRQRYAAILNSQQTFVARCDPAGRVTYLNDAHARAFDLKLGDDIATRVHPDDRGALDGALRALGSPPHHVTTEHRWLAHGQWRHVLWHASAILDDSGRVAEVQGVGFDITDRKLAERDLATVTSNIPCLLWQADAEGLPGWEQDVDGRQRLYRWDARIIDESAARRVFPLDVPPGQSYLEAWYASRHPEDTDAVHASTAQALIMGLASYSREFRCYDRTGQVHWLHEEVAVQRAGAAGDGGGGPRWQLFGVVTDVTPRKLAEVAVRESEHRFRTMGDSAPVLIWLTNADDQTTWYNKPWRDFVGLAHDAGPADGWENVLHPDDRDRCVRAYEANFAARTPFQIEYRLRRHDGAYRWFLDHAVPRRHPDGTFAGFIGSCTDITDRKRAELELATVTSRVPCILWRSTVDGLPGWRDDHDGQRALFRWDLTIIDEAAAQRLLPIDVPAGKRYRDVWGSHLHPDDRPHLRRTTARALLSNNPYYDREYRVVDRHGRLHWFHEDVFLEPRGPGAWVLFGVVTDVTPHKLAELALRESEARYDLAARSGRVGIWDWDLLTGTIYLSDNLKELLGYPPDFPLEHPPTWHDHLHPDDVRPVIAATTAHFEGRTPAYELEVRRRHRDGTYRWFLARGTATRDPATGFPVRMTGSLTDITDRKRAEDALRASESRYALATGAGRVGVWEYDVDADALYLSPNASALLGYAPGDITTMAAWRGLIHPDDLPRVLAANADPTCVEFESEVRRRHKDGTYRWLLSRGTKTRDPATGRLLRVTGAHTDITDRKRAEEALRASEARYALATEAGRVGVWEYDVDAGTVHHSPNSLALLGYAPDEIATYDAWMALVHPDDRAAGHAARDNPAADTFEVEIRRRHKDGTWRWFLSRGSIARDPATGRALRMTGAHTDITDRKRADEARRASEARYALATEAAHVGVWEYDYDADAFYLSPNLPVMLGYPPDRFKTFPDWLALVHPDDVPKIHASMYDARAVDFDMEIRHRHADGSWRWLSSRGTMTRDPATGRLVRINGIFTDVTDRRRAEDALRTSEARFALATDAGRVGILDHDYESGTVYVSPKLAALHGYDPAELTSFEAWSALVDPDEVPRLLAVRNDPAITSFELETRRRHKDGTWRWFLSRGTIARDPATGRAVHLTGSLTDITDLKRADAALRTSEARYALATGAGRVGVWEYDADADALYLSPTSHEMLGYAPGDLRTFAQWVDLVHPEDRHLIETSRADRSADTFEFEIRRRCKDGTYRWFLARGTFARDPATGRITRITGIHTDVTDRKVAELRYALATDAGRVGIWEVDYVTGALYLSPKIAELHGYTPAELTTLDDWHALVHPDDRGRVLAVRNTPTVTTFELETRRRHKDGAWLWFLSRGTVARAPDGSPLRLTGTLTDITEFKRAEEALRESERRFTLAAAAGRVGIVDLDLVSDRLFLSPALKSLLGYADHELTDDHGAWHRLLHPDDVPRVRALYDDYVAGRSPTYELEVRRRHKDGSYRWLLSRGSLLRDPATGAPVRYTGSLTDITDRKVAEDALRESQRRYAIATEAGGVGIWDYEDATDTLYLSPNLLAMLGYAPDEVTTIDAWRDLLHPDDRAAVLASSRDYHDPTFAMEVRRRRKDGTYRWFLSRGVVAFDPATRRRARITGVLADITDRKRAEEALRASEEHFRTLLEQSPLATFVFSPDGDYLRSNQAAVDMYGFGPDELADYNVFTDSVLTGTPVLDAFRRARDGHRADLPETRLTPDRGRLAGHAVWIRGSVYPLRDPATGRVHALVSLNEDITERKRVEQALLSSERRFRKLVEQSPLSTQFFAPDGTMRAANRAWERLFGIRVGDLTGSYNVLHDPQLADRGIAHLIRRAFVDGEPTPIPAIPYVPWFGEFAGQERWTTALVFPVKDAAGRIEEVVLIHHDQTEQKRAEDALRASEAQYRTAADANRRLLLELDHRVRNNLAGLTSLVSLMRDRAPDVDAFAASIGARLRAMSHVHHLLSASGGQDLDLRALLSSFLSHSRDLAPYPTPVRLDGPPVLLPSPLALPLTLILSEFLTNSAKYGAHSSPSGSVSLTWSLTSQSAPDSPSSNPQSAIRNPQSHLSLHWTEHNGPPPHPHPVPSLGSALIESFSTRELAGACSLTYPPSGAAHTLAFPLPPA